MFKKIFYFIVIGLFLSSPVKAVESCDVTIENPTANIFEILFTIITAADGSLAACSSSGVWGTTVPGLITEIFTDPSGTNPTALYDITLTGYGDSYNLVGSALSDRSATLVERAVPFSSTGDVMPAQFIGPFTLNMSNNIINSATIKVLVKGRILH